MRLDYLFANLFFLLRVFLVLSLVLPVGLEILPPRPARAAVDLSSIKWVVLSQTDFYFGQSVFDQMKEMGVQAVVDGVPWSIFEPTNGNFDFTFVDQEKSRAEAAGLIWIPQIALHYVPDWLYALDVDSSGCSRYRFKFRNGTCSSSPDIPNIFHPNVYTYVDRAINAFVDRYKSANVPLIYVSTGTYGETYYPEGDNFAAFDDYTIASWRSYTGNASAMPYSSSTANDGSGGSLSQFLSWWYSKLYDYIRHVHGLIQTGMPSTTGLGLKISHNPPLGQIAEDQVAAALPYNLKVASFGGPLSQSSGSQKVGEVARNNGLYAWVESFLKPYAGITNTIEETRTRIASYGLDAYMYAQADQLFYKPNESPPNEPKSEYYYYKTLVEDMTAGFETWSTNDWTTSNSGGATVATSTTRVKRGRSSLRLTINGTSGSRAEAYRQKSYSNGDVVLDGWRYLASSTSASSLYWVVEGYNASSTLKFRAYYWSGTSDPGEGNAAPGGGANYYRRSISLDSPTATSQWLRTTRKVNTDLDDYFGTGTWSGLGVTTIRIRSVLSGSGAAEGYFDDVRIVDYLPYVVNGGFEDGASFWSSSTSGAGTAEISSSLPRSGSKSLRLRLNGGSGSSSDFTETRYYPGGNVVLDGGRYLVSSSSSALYWLIEGYGGDGALKFRGYYWGGSSNPGGGNATPSETGGYYRINVQLDSGTTGQWLRTVRRVDQDVDNTHGSGTWINMNIVTLRIKNMLSGSGAAEGYFDDVNLADALASVVNGDFESGTNFWNSTVSGNAAMSASTAVKRGGSSSLRVTANGSSGASIQVYEDVSYTAGDVVLDGWRYLVSSSSPSSLYWVVEGYNEDSTLKYRGVYWSGSDNWERENATPSQTGGHYAVKVKLGMAMRTGEWLHTVKVVNRDLDWFFGSGTWNSLGITRVRLINVAWGNAAVEGYFDDVGFSWAASSNTNAGFETGDLPAWDGVSSGDGTYNISSSHARSGSYSLRLAVSGTIEGSSSSVYQFFDYSSGDVVLDGWRYLVNSTSPSSLSWVVEGYNSSNTLKYRGVYWSGTSNWDQDNAPPSQTGGHYAVKVALSSRATTGTWLRTQETINRTLDTLFGAGTWSSLGIAKIKLIVNIWGNGAAEGYVDDVSLTIGGSSSSYGAYIPVILNSRAN